MTASFIITLRETLEAALIVGIIIGFLKRTKQYNYYKMVWYGVAAGIILSIFGAILFQEFAGGFSGRSEELFEGITMIVGGILVTTLVVWVMRRRNFVERLIDKVAHHTSKAKPWAFFFMVLVAILREGIEIVIFLQSASMVSSDKSLLGALLGIVVAIVLGLALYFGSLKIDLKRFFSITGVILILFAAGLLAHGVHELQEAKVMPVLIEEVWDINPTVLVEGAYPAWHEKGSIGGFFKGLFGYNGNPSLMELITYIVYLSGIAYFWRKVTGQVPTN